VTPGGLGPLLRRQFRATNQKEPRELIGRYVTGHKIALVPLARLMTGDLEAFYASYPTDRLALGRCAWCKRRYKGGRRRHA
jgi:hypothetical protein